MSVPGAVLALDVGTRTIGVAVTDPGRTHVFPVTTVARRSVRRDVEVLAELARGRAVVQVVVGVARDADGGEGRSARLARQVGDALAARTGLPVAYVDEAFTTLEAHARLGDAGVFGAARRAASDQAAAVVILEGWLGAEGGG